MKNKIIIFLVLASFSGFGQITRTLPNVTNTADSMKPVSVAQKAAIVQKLQTVASISALQGFTDATICQFDGSTWNKVAGNVASNGGAFAGTIVQVNSSFYWERSYDSFINVKWFGAIGEGDDYTTQFTNAKNYCYKSKISTLFVPAGEYILNNFNLDSVDGFGINLLGEGTNSLGKRTKIIQRFKNSSAILVNNITTKISNLSFTNYAGKVGNVTAVTANTLTYTSSLPPVIWTTTTTTQVATDGTVYPNAIIINCLGGYYASGFTDNLNGTYTLTGIKGGFGTLNSNLLNIPIGQKIEQFISLAHQTDLSTAKGIIYVGIKENQIYNDLWFAQTAIAFEFAEFGSGSGPGVGDGNLGFFNNIIFDGAGYGFYSTGTIFGMQGSNIHFYGTGIGIKTLKDFSLSQLTSNIYCLSSRLFECRDVLNVILNNMQCGGITGIAYNDNFINFRNAYKFKLNNNMFGRSTAPVIVASGTIEGFDFVGNTIESFAEGTNNGFMTIGGASFINSKIEGNTIMRKYSSSYPFLMFTNTSCDITGFSCNQDLVTNLALAKCDFQTVASPTFNILNTDSKSIRTINNSTIDVNSGAFTVVKNRNTYFLGGNVTANINLTFSYNFPSISEPIYISNGAALNGFTVTLKVGTTTFGTLPTGNFMLIPVDSSLGYYKIFL